MRTRHLRTITFPKRSLDTKVLESVLAIQLINLRMVLLFQVSWLKSHAHSVFE